MYFISVDLEKAFDCVPREVTWQGVRKKGLMEQEMRVVMEMYKGAETSVKLEGEMSEWFQVEIGLRQGLVFRPLLFAIVMNALTDDEVKPIKEYLCANDLVLAGENWKKWRSTKPVLLKRRYASTWLPVCGQLGEIVN